MRDVPSQTKQMRAQNAVNEPPCAMRKFDAEIVKPTVLKQMDVQIERGDTPSGLLNAGRSTRCLQVEEVLHHLLIAKK